MLVPVYDRPSVAEPTETQDRAVMESRSATIHRKMPIPARQLPITESAHKAGIVGDADLAAILAPLDMTAERRRSACLDRGHDLALIEGEPVALRSAKRVAVAAKNVRHLQLRTHARRLFRRDQLA